MGRLLLWVISESYLMFGVLIQNEVGVEDYIVILTYANFICLLMFVSIFLKFIYLVESIFSQIVRIFSTFLVLSSLFDLKAKVYIGVYCIPITFITLIIISTQMPKVKKDERVLFYYYFFFHFDLNKLVLNDEII